MGGDAESGAGLSAMATVTFISRIGLEDPCDCAIVGYKTTKCSTTTTATTTARSREAGVGG